MSLSVYSEIIIDIQKVTKIIHRDPGTLHLASLIGGILI